MTDVDMFQFITQAVWRHELSFRSRYQILFFFFFFLGGGGGGGRNGPRDKTSGHELSSRSRFLYSGGTS